MAVDMGKTNFPGLAGVKISCLSTVIHKNPTIKKALLYWITCVYQQLWTTEML